jgi:hypothetical protein
VHAPEPPIAWRRAWLRARRVARLPCHTNGVGCAFHPRAVASNHSMISCGSLGWCPSKARRLRIRCTDSVIFSHDPLNGVYSGIIPWLNSHRTISGVLCPAKLSQINSIRSGGTMLGNVTRTVKPSCHCAQNNRVSSGLRVDVDSGNVASTSVNSAFSQPWRTGLTVVVTPLTLTSPVAG